MDESVVVAAAAADFVDNDDSVDFAVDAADAVVFDCCSKNSLSIGRVVRCPLKSSVLGYSDM